MKRLLIAFLLMTCFGNMLQAQMKDAKKQAGKAFGLAKNAATRAEAAKLMGEAISKGKSASDGKPGDLAKLYVLQGQMLGLSVADDANSIQLEGLTKKEATLTSGNNSQLAFESFTKAFEAQPVKGDLKACITGLVDLANNGVAISQKKYKLKDYVGAYQDGNQILKIKELLNKNGNKSILDKEEDYLSQLYFVGAMAYLTEKTSDAEGIFKQLYDKGYKEPLVYEAMFNIKSEKKEADAYDVLQKGISLFPEEKSLRYAEINYFIQQGKFAELETKLQAEMEKSPDNASLILTMGNVYDNLYQEADKKNDTAKAAQYFEKAMSFYKKTSEKDAKNFNAHYSMGAMFYNKAASVIKIASELPLSKIKETEALEAQAKDLFKKALPNFENAYNINPKDKNVLIALKEIAVRLNDMTKASKYKNELEALGN